MLLSEKQIAEELASIPNWKYENNCLSSEFSFSTFVEAFSFMTSLAFLSEKLNHHPDWSNCYNKVNITLSTHDEGGVTSKDIGWAKTCTKIYQKSS